MTTELHTALREAVADAPHDDHDLRTVLEAGSRRVRRRAALRVGSSALVVAAAATAVAVTPDPPDEEPRPANVVQLDLGRADRQDLDVLASVRTTSRDESDIDHDRFEGLTTDGLVLRSRYSYSGDIYELGLLDPETGSTDWLPSPPVAALHVVELTADRLVLFSSMSSRPGALLVFDRRTEAWSSTPVRLPATVEVHIPPRLELAPDGRLYLGNNLEGESGPMHWWSYAVPEGGAARTEPALEGAVVTWGEGVRASVDSEGRVVVSTSNPDRVLAEERPTGCEAPTDADLADMPLLLLLAGDRPVVTYWCGDELEPMTIVYDVTGAEALQVAGAFVRSADETHVLLAAAEGQHKGVYLLDLDRTNLARIGPGTHESQVGLAEGLVLLNQPGPIDRKDVYDVVWKVARLPFVD